MIDLPLEPEENSAQQTANSTGPPRNRQDQVTKRSKAYMAKVLSLAAFLSQTRIRKYIYIYIYFSECFFHASNTPKQLFKIFLPQLGGKKKKVHNPIH